MYIITSYEIINGTKIQSRDKNKPALSIDHINALQQRAERMWNRGSKHPVTVYINYKVPINQHVKWK